MVWRGLGAILSICFVLQAAPAQGLQPLGFGKLQQIDAVVQASIERGDMPGAVVLVLYRGEVVFRKAYGLRSKEPSAESMTPDTLFDLASLTKPIATATSIMILVEQGKLRLSDRVAQHLPAFAQNGKERITVEHLLLHTSGLIADNPESEYSDGREKALERVFALKPTAEPGARFVYSDMGFIVLGELVHKLSGQPLDVFARAHVFAPLGMKETTFRPLDAGVSASRIAPADRRDGKMIRGEVHDPRAYALGGVAGHAGLFSTADDLARYARMILGDRPPVLGSLTLRLMTTPRPVPTGLRAYGWDVNTSYSANRGELFPIGESFGHTGFTGTSIWIHPETQSAVIFLSNRLHPTGRGNVTRVRGQVATIAAASLLGGSRPQAVAGPSTPTQPPPRRTPVLTGIDILARDHFQLLQNRRVGLVTNHSGRDRHGRSTIDLLHEAKGVTLVALFSPEHGIRGALDTQVGDSKDEKTGLPIYSLYGTRRRPTPETLQGIDTLVYDIQDAGCRFYTYISTLGGVLEAAALARDRGQPIKVIVLDRPNPIGGVAVEGPLLDAGKESFVAYHRLPVRHGLTVGELALLFNAEHRVGDRPSPHVELEVVRMEGWHRGDFYDRTGLEWVNPSPNLRSLTEAFLYPGIGLLETTNVSVGRGTDRPFEWVGAPWLDGRRLTAELNRENLPGVRFVPRTQTPASSVHKGKACSGVDILVEDWSRFHPLETGLAFACALRRVHPREWEMDRYDRLLGHQATLEAIKAGRRWQEIVAGWAGELDAFRPVRAKYLLYAE